MTEKWQGNLKDDCTLRRYGLLAHVECMGRGSWWFSISREDAPLGEDDLYNTANNHSYVALSNGDMARAAAEIVMEVLAARAVQESKSTQETNHGRLHSG